MNKLQGFYELQKSSLPTVPWKEFTPGIKLDRNILWTIRTAVWEGDDLSLPRKIGVSADDAERFAEETLRTLGKNSIVIFYPYFIADKSGVLEVANDKLVIEAVQDDLWNLVTHNKLDVSITFIDGEVKCIGDNDFLKQEEISELVNYSGFIKRKYKYVLLESKSVFLEWSYAYKSDLNKCKVGNRSLVFYELRSVN